MDEVKQIYETETASAIVKDAFVFTRMTGLRFVDIKALTWDNVNMKESLLRIRRSKTKKGLEMKLNDMCMTILKKFKANS
jgi:integrase